MRITPSQCACLVLIVFMLASILTRAHAQASEGSEEANALLHGALDRYFAERMESWFIPGAVCAVVHHGEVVFLKGFGVESTTANQSIDPAQSQFYIASVGKLFTALAVLQLADKGTVDLHTDVNEYLTAFKLDDTFAEPVTLDHLLTHTGGFDERTIGYSAREPEEIEPLRTYLARRMPPRVTPPGTVVSYSNHGFGLAGLVVEEVSGRRFQDYVQQEILDRLGMSHSISGGLPVSDEHLVQGYWSTGDSASLPYSHVTPAGGMFTTGADMARLLILLLGDGLVDGITPELRANLCTTHFAHHPSLPGYGYAMYERRIDGTRGWEIGGSAPGAAASVFVVPQHKLGIFVALDRQEPDFALDVAPIVLNALSLANTSSEPNLPSADDPALPLASFEGTYRPARYANRTLEKVATLFQGFEVRSDSEGNLDIDFPGRIEPRTTRWYSLGDLLFHSSEGPALLAFGTDGDRVDYLFCSEVLNAPWAFEKVPAYETPRFVGRLLAAVCLVFAALFVTIPLAAVIRRFRKNRSPRPASSYRVSALVVLISGLNLAFVVGFTLVLSDIYTLATGPTPLLYATLTLSLIAIMASLMLLFDLVRPQGRFKTVPWTMAAAILVLVASAPFYAMLHVFNLIGYRM